MKFSAKINPGDSGSLPLKKSKPMRLFSSIEKNKMEELRVSNFIVLRNLKSITKNGGNIEFEYVNRSNTTQTVSVPEDVAVSVLNKSLKNGLVAKTKNKDDGLNKGHIANVMKQISKCDNRMADQLLAKSTSKEKSNWNKFIGKTLIGVLLLPLDLVASPTGRQPGKILTNLSETVDNWVAYRELKDIYSTALLASDKDTTATVEKSNKRPHMEIPSPPRIKLQSDNFESFTHEIYNRDLQMFEEICKILEDNKYQREIDQLKIEYKAYCEKHNIS